MFFFQPDYDDIEDEARMNHFQRGKSGKGKDNMKYGELYYITSFWRIYCQGFVLRLFLLLFKFKCDHVIYVYFHYNQV